ncbi:hypothetical protein PIB30_054295 [Stylosanthes scabra]|uniref:Uncharacterized protein n=1 Tax=Stylosanthes scabra TaxID=79078 RepID=A0ABU6YIX2_9FABA|nr:hypothetical protein [Stylosanthes scabra]
MAVESAINNLVLKELVEPAVTKPTAQIPLVTVVNSCRMALILASRGKLHMRTHRCQFCQLGVPPKARMRTHRLQQWPSKSYCDPFVPFALSGHFRSELCLLNPETLKRTHQSIVWNEEQFKT